MVLSVLLASAAPCRATTIDWVGTYTNWATTWTPINSLNDPTDQTNDSIDFVGDTTDPVAAYAVNADYYMFRMQIALDTFPTTTPPNNSYFIMIDLPGATAPDYAIAWDAKSNDNTRHGMEMLQYNTGSTWDDLKSEDLDGNSGQKLTVDINGDGRTTDGYLRSIDGITTTNFGAVSWIEFAISKTYIDTYVPALSDFDTWNIQFASSANSNDNNKINGDVAGNVSLTEPINPDDFTPPSIVPEPGTFMLMSTGLLGLLGYRRRGNLLSFFRRSKQ
jgi:hypothetical protein